MYGSNRRKLQNDHKVPNIELRNRGTGDMERFKSRQEMSNIL